MTLIQNLKIKRGCVRSDGLIFWRYRGSSEVWISELEFKKQLNLQKQNELQWKLKNPDGSRNKLKNWRIKNRERSRQTAREYYKKNSEKLKNRSKQFRKNNPESFKKTLKKYREKNSALINHLNSRRRKNIVVPSHSWNEAIKSFYDISKRVSNCLGIAHHVDHIIPISCGGLHVQTNLQILPRSLNLRKNNNLDYKLPNCYITNANNQRHNAVNPLAA